MDEPFIEMLDLHGSKLRITTTRITKSETEFRVSIEKSWAKAEIVTSTYVVGSPVELFRDLAKHWQGWTGEKSWEDLGRRLTICATCNLTGHIYIRVTFRKLYEEDQVVLNLEYEAGQLERISSKVSWLFKMPPNKAIEP